MLTTLVYFALLLMKMTAPLQAVAESSVVVQCYQCATRPKYPGPAVFRPDNDTSNVDGDPCTAAMPPVQNCSVGAAVGGRFGCYDQFMGDHVVEKGCIWVSSQSEQLDAPLDCTEQVNFNATRTQTCICLDNLCNNSTSLPHNSTAPKGPKVQV